MKSICLRDHKKRLYRQIKIKKLHNHPGYVRISRRKLDTTFLATALQNVLASLTSHPLKETVHSCPVALFWLKCSFGHFELSFAVSYHHCLLLQYLVVPT